MSVATRIVAPFRSRRRRRRNDGRAAVRGDSAERRQHAPRAFRAPPEVGESVD